jgi:hypothetical protein
MVGCLKPEWVPVYVSGFQPGTCSSLVVVSIPVYICWVNWAWLHTKLATGNLRIAPNKPAPLSV